MGMSSKPDVIQGRLGWEQGDLSEADPNELDPHPANERIYGDTEDPAQLGSDFIESVREKGVLEPLIITSGKTVISGHRRQLAAIEVGLATVPVIYYEFEDELAEREALVELNRQREKTPGQVINEFDEILDIISERKEDERKKKISQSLSNGKNAETSETFRTSKYSDRSVDEAAERVNANVSGRTLEKGLKVKEKAEKGDETAQNEWRKLLSGGTSYHQAYKTVEKAEAEAEIQKQQQPSFQFDPNVVEQNAVEFFSVIDTPDLIIADPPYSTDLDDVVEFARSWVPDMLGTIGSDGRAFIFIGAYPAELQAYLNVLKVHDAIDRTEVLVWTYRNTLGQTPNYHYKRNWQAILFIQSDPPTQLNTPKTAEQWAVQDVNAPDARNGQRYHKWEKPEDLISRFIRHTTEEGDLVIDPFVGTGTTVLAAAKLGRRAIGADVDPDMLDIAVDRGCVFDG